MSMKNENTIFDVGAFNGLDGIILALLNPKITVHAFEANPYLIKIIKLNKKKIENYKKKKISNYKINNLAVTNKNCTLMFNIAKNPTVSSLNNFSKDIDRTWPGWRQAHCTVIKRVKVKAVTLKKYCEENDIKKINYLHIDTQGSDLKVLMGLQKKIEIVERGVLEAAVNKQTSLYQSNHTISDTRKFLKKNRFKISKIDNIDRNIKYEKNIYFYKRNVKRKKILNIKYNLRYYNRIINGNLYLKDRIFDFIGDLLGL